MMPVSPCTQAPTVPFSAINHYTTTSPSKSVPFDSMPSLRGEHSSYCSFNNISHHDGYYKDEELNDSDSETYWRTGGMHKHMHCVLKSPHRKLGCAKKEESPPRGALRSPATTREQGGGGGAASGPTLISTSSSRGRPLAGAGHQYPLLYQRWLVQCGKWICWAGDNCSAAITCWRGVLEPHTVKPAGTKKHGCIFILVLTELSDLRLGYFGGLLVSKKNKFSLTIIFTLHLSDCTCSSICKSCREENHLFFFLSKFLIYQF